MTDLTSSPCSVNTLFDLLRVLRGGLDAMQTFGVVTSELRQDYNDEDGKVETAVDAGEASERELGLAIAYVERLIATAIQVPAPDATDQETADQFIKLAAAHANSTLKASPRALLDLATDVAAEVQQKAESIDPDDEDAADDVTIELSISFAEHLLGQLEVSALALHAASQPLEIAIDISGGSVQAVRRAGDRAAAVYVHDHDVAVAGPGSASIVFNDTPETTYPCALYRHDGESVEAGTPFWLSVRAEAARLETIEQL